VIEVDPASGLISIMGGKWTTHRAMAEDTINSVQEALGVAVTDCPTRSHLLHGGEGFTKDLWKEIGREYPVSQETAQHLTGKFGTAAWNVLNLTRENANLARPIVAGSAPIQAEVVYSMREELAATIEDVLARRTGIQFYSWREAIQAAPVVGSLMAEELRWSDAEAKTAITAYVDKINHLLERAGLEQERSEGSSAGRSKVV
jgi:glycerol-3-phosphate dehydrogenase